MNFRLKNCDIFPMPNSKGRLLHLGTIEYGLREFVVMLSPEDAKIYIEEVVLNTIDFKNDVFANLKHIKDDNLFHDLSMFVREKGIDEMKGIVERLIDQGKMSWLTTGSTEIHV